MGRLLDRGGIGGLPGSDSDSELEASLGGPGGLEAAEMNFLGALEIPSSENGSSCWLGCSVSALVGGILIVSSSNKAASLPCPVTVEIGGISPSSPPNLGALTHRGAGSSETEAVVNIPIYSPFPLLLSIVSITLLIYFRSIYLKHTI